MGKPLKLRGFPCPNTNYQAYKLGDSSSKFPENHAFEFMLSGNPNFNQETDVWCTYLVGGFFPPIWKICSSNWIIFPGDRDENKKMFESTSQIIQVIHLSDLLIPKRWVCHFSPLKRVTFSPSQKVTTWITRIMSPPLCHLNLNLLGWYSRRPFAHLFNLVGHDAKVLGNL